MKIAIMQPYFFPYLGYFDLLNCVDLFLVYDTVQYIRRGWIHRNRVLHQSGAGWQYINVAITKMPQKTPISEVGIKDNPCWEERILGQLMHYRHTAPYATETVDFVERCINFGEPLISRLNVHILEECSKLINIDFRYQFSSELAADLRAESSAEERILELCQFLGATEYVNLPGGVDLYHPYAFERRGIKLTFRKLPSLTYPTGPYTFEPNLSIIDVLMWNSPQVIKKYLDKHKDGENNHA